MGYLIKHHYIPVFYLTQWTGEDGKLIEFSRPHPGVLAKTARSPRGAGYENDLYKRQTPVPDEIAQSFETEFTKKLDTLASNILPALLAGKTEWNLSERSSWARFVTSLMLRNPEEFKAFQAAAQSAWNNGLSNLQPSYDAVRNGIGPASVREFVDQENPALIEGYVFDLGEKLLDHTEIGKMINAMSWATIDVSSASHDLFTSDRPVVRAMKIQSSQGFIALPISPKKLFVAGANAEVVESFKVRSPELLVKSINTDIVESAVRYVYGCDIKQSRFVQNRMGKRPYQSIFQRMQTLHEKDGLGGREITGVNPAWEYESIVK